MLDCKQSSCRMLRRSFRRFDSPSTSGTRSPLVPVVFAIAIAIAESLFGLNSISILLLFPYSRSTAMWEGHPDIVLRSPSHFPLSILNFSHTFSSCPSSARLLFVCLQPLPASVPLFVLFLSCSCSCSWPSTRAYPHLFANDAP